MGKSAFLPPSPFERGLQLLQEPSCLEGLEDSVFVGLWSELAGPGTEKDPSTVRYSFVHLFRECLLSTYIMPKTVQGWVFRDE